MTDAHTIIKIFVACAGLVLLAIIGWVITMRIRKSFMGGNESNAGVGFSLTDLEKMYRNGELTEAEFKNIKRKRALRAAGYTEDVPPPRISKPPEPPKNPPAGPPPIPPRS